MGDGDRSRAHADRTPDRTPRRAPEPTSLAALSHGPSWAEQSYLQRALGSASLQWGPAAGVDVDALREWLELEPPQSAQPASTFDPSLARFDDEPRDPLTHLGPGASPALLAWLAEAEALAPDSASVDIAAFEPAPLTAPLPFAAMSPASADDFSHPALRAPLGGFPLPSGRDPFQQQPCPGSCHQQVYGRRTQPAPPYDPTPDWIRSRNETHQAALAREAQTTEATTSQIGLQVLTARSQALAAAANAGAVPADLQERWQQATIAAEALELAMPGLRSVAAPAGPTAPVAPAGEQRAVEPELQDNARNAIDAFYWSLVDALQVREAELRAWERRSQHLNAQLEDQAAMRCPTARCHTPNPTRLPVFVAPQPRSPRVMHLAQALSAADDVTSWRTSIRDFRDTSTTVLDAFLIEALPSDAREVEQLKLATGLQRRLAALTALRPDAVRVPAVFYPKNDLAYTEQADGTRRQTAQGYPWYLYLYREGTRVVLKDLTSDRIFTNVGGDDERHGFEAFALERRWGDYQGSAEEIRYPNGTMSRLFGELNSSLRFPEGTLYYTLPGGRQRQLETTEPTSFSTWLTGIGLSLAALGIVLLTAGAGTPAAVALIGSAVVGAAGTATELAEREEQGIATEADRRQAMLFIAADIASALTLGLGRVASAPATFGRLATMAGRVYAPVKAINLGLDVAQAYVMTTQFVAQFEAVRAIRSSDERDRAMMRLVAVALATGALTVTSIRGDVTELARGGRPGAHLGADGEMNVRARAADVPPVAVRTAIDEVGDAAGTGWRWRAPAAGPTAEDTTIGYRSVVVDIERRGDGLVTGVSVRHGPGARASDIRLHEEIAELVRSFGGIQGRIRLAWREIVQMFGQRRPPFHLEIEVWKLEELARRRMAILRGRGTSPSIRRDARRELQVIENNLEAARRRARRALDMPPTTEETAQIWMRDAPDGYPTTPQNMGWYRGANGRWQLRDLPNADAGGVRIRASYDDAGNLLEVNNRQQVEAARVIGRPLSEVTDRLTAMGYRVDSLDRINRTGQNTGYMVALTVDADRRVRESVRETVRDVQQRLERELSSSQRAALGAVRDRGATVADSEVVLLEGIFDLRVRWSEVIAHNGGRQSIIERLEDAGVNPSEAIRIVNGLEARTTNLQVIRGTAPLRNYDYSGSFTGNVPAGGDVHHADPLYLAGTHELLIGLDPTTHASVHRLFDSLRLPARSALPAQTLSPASLRAAIPAHDWRRGAATLHGRGSVRAGHIDYDSL